MIAAIFAADEQGGIGNNGSMPWPTNKDDLKWFKDTTLNQAVVMGKGTWDSEGMPKPLPNRVNVVITSKPLETDLAVPCSGDVKVILKHLVELYPDKDIFVIGGANVLQQAAGVFDKIYLTKIPGNYECDTKVSLDDLLKDFSLVEIKDLQTAKVEIYEAITPGV